MSLATAPQVKFIVSLADSKGMNVFVSNFDRLAEANGMYTFNDYDETVESAAQRLSKRLASTMIDWMKREDNLPRKAAPAVESAEKVELVGMHKSSDGRIFKVQKSKSSGREYAKELVNNSEGASFEYAPGAMRGLSTSTKMSLEEAKEYGALYGTCCVCARTLTDEGSIEAGIGPVCASKF